MTRSTVATIALVLLAVAPAAAAPPKVALTAIENDDGDLREAVAEALEGPELTLVGARATSRAIDNLKGELADLTEKQAKKLSNELEADAIVYGKFDKGKRSKILRFKMFVNGKKTKGFSVQFSNPKSKKFKRALREKIVEKISSSISASDPDETTTTKKKAKPAAEDDEDPIAGKKGKKGKAPKDEPEKSAKAEPEAKADKDDTAEADKDDADDEDKPRKGSKKTAKLDDDGEGDELTVSARPTSSGKGHSANRVAIRIDVGGSVSARQLAFTSTPELGENSPKPFKQAPVPGVRFEIEMYPLAFMDPKSFAAGLGAAVEFDRVLKSNATVEGGLDDGNTSPVKQQSYAFGGRYRLAFGKTPTSPTITVGASYGRRTFQVQKGEIQDRANLDLPDTDYKYIAPLLGFRIPFTKNVAFVAQGEALLVRDAGPIQEADSYGRAKVFGIDGSAGLDVVIGNRFALKLVGEFNQIGFTFVGGGGELARNRDGDPMTVDIGGALDRSFGGSATLAVLY
jgi:hypothetical protein